jgi:hypothetical protein
MTSLTPAPRTVRLLLTLGIVLSAACRCAAAADDSRTYAINEKIEGKTYEQWSAAFVRWAYGIKRDRNPITDRTGEFAGEGQAGPVWFLAGNFGGITKRRVKVPAGKPIFSPIIYKLTDADAAENLAGRLKDAEITLDGKSLGDLSNNRIATPPFEFAGPDENEAVHPFVARKNRLAMDGWWMMLKPLATGEHTLHIKARLGAENVEDEFELDITYRLISEETAKE